MTSDELCYLDLVEAGRRIQARQLSSLEVTQAMLDRIARFDPRFKCFAKPTPELALAQARQADSEISRGTLRGPLHGVQSAVKDLCHTKGIGTAAGMPIHKDYRPTRDATVVSRLREAGAVLLGKLQLTEGAFGAHHPAIDPRSIRGAPGIGQVSLRAVQASRQQWGSATLRWGAIRVVPSASLNYEWHHRAQADLGTRQPGRRIRASGIHWTISGP